MTFWSILLFCSDFGKKKCSKNSFLAYFCNFWCTFWYHLHKRYYQHGLVSEKKYKKYFSLRKCQQEAITQYWLKSAKILKLVFFVSIFNAPNTAKSSRNWSILLHWKQNFINLDNMTKICDFWKNFFLSITLQMPSVWGGRGEDA